MLRNGGHKKTAVCGVVIALSLTLMFLPAVIPFSTFAAPAIAGLLMLVIKLEYGTKWSLLSFFAVSVLSALFAPEKEAVLVFVALLGYYPVIKTPLDKLKPRLLSLAVKLSVFNASVVSSYTLAIKIFGLDDATRGAFTVTAVMPLMVLSNITFVFYDAALNRFMRAYYFKIRKYLRF